MTNSKRKPSEVAPSLSDARQDAMPAGEISEEMIALRAYKKWQARGCPLWENEQDWFAARAELVQEAGALRT